MSIDIIYTIIFGIIFLIVVAVATGMVTVIERRVAGRVQSRIGPNRVGFQGILQWVADGLKAIQKEDIRTRDQNGALFRIAPYFVFGGMFAAWAAIPLGATAIMADLNVGIFYIVAVTSLVVLGLILAGWSSNNKWSLLGGMRSAAQLISYEIPSGLVIFIIVMLAGSLSMQDIVKGQGPDFKDWFIFRNPFTFAAAIVFFTASLAEGNRVPFDIPEAESELVSGYNTEYSGMRFIFFFFAEYANLYIMGALMSVLFLGGWNFWWQWEVSIPLPGKTFSFEVLGFLWLMFKIMIIVFLVIMLRWTLPRLRVDQLMSICWKYLVPITIVCSLGVMFWMYFFLDGSRADVITRYVMSGFGALLLLLFAARVVVNLIVMKAKIHANPFI